jgi:hypothetical protein
VFEYREPTKPLEVDELRLLRCQAERFTQSVSIPSTTLGILAPSIPIDIADEFESEPKPVDGDDFNLVEVDGAKFKHARACFVNGKRSCLWSLDLHLGPAYRNGVLPFIWENHTRSRRPSRPVTHTKTHVGNLLCWKCTLIGLSPGYGLFETTINPIAVHAL